ncbi:unnamed protein product [Litomosoides sigmodontis]|uniref:Uncharacterized protein n=1 Tax=Litomosoides sigmodontis TaxID=42156 RepID=A0A3P6V2R7_LITSI|nr:unnamed protein product [Litomosoides sigmodontis]
MCLPELSEDDSDEYCVCCGGLHSYVASVFFCVIDFWSTCSMFFLIALFHYHDEQLTTSVKVPLFVLYISFLTYLSGPIGLYFGHVLLVAFYYCRIVVMLFFALAWAVINSGERKSISDIVLTVLWSLTAFTYFIGSYVHSKTYKFFRTRWIGYDDGDLAFAAKLRAQGLPVAAYDMREYFASINLEHESARQHNKAFTVATAEKKD